MYVYITVWMSGESWLAIKTAFNPFSRPDTQISIIILSVYLVYMY